MPVTFSALLFTAGLLLLVWRPAGRERSPFAALAGLLAVFAGVLSLALSGDALGVVARSLFVDAGVALLAVAAVLAARRGGGRGAGASFFALGLAMLLAGVAIAAGLRLLAPPTAETAATFLLELGPDDRVKEVAPLLARYDARYERAFPALTAAMDEDLSQTFLVSCDAAVRERLMAQLRADAENVDFVEHNGTVRLAPPRAARTGAAAAGRFLADDPLLAHQWGLHAIGGPEAHALLRDVLPEAPAVVAILDTGVDAEHEDLQGALAAMPAAADPHGHGTHCAGIAGAATNNGVGVASLNWEGRFVRVAGYRALPAGGTGTFETIAQAIVDATRDGVDVISMSLGDVGPVPPRVLSEAVDFALRSDVVVVASAGNSDADARTHFPSNIDGVIAVAAVDRDLRKARFSNTNTSLSRPLAAPGVDVVSLKPGGVYAPMSGTSMATPMVAGLIGVLRALEPGLSAADAYALLHRTGRVVEDTGRVGRVVDAEAAIGALRPRAQR